jgi:hypothetical protein
VSIFHCHEPIEYRKVVHTYVCGPMSDKISVNQLGKRPLNIQWCYTRILNFSCTRNVDVVNLLFISDPPFFYYISFLPLLRPWWGKYVLSTCWGRAIINAICQIPRKTTSTLSGQQTHSQSQTVSYFIGVWCMCALVCVCSIITLINRVLWNPLNYFVHSDHTTLTCTCG